MSRLPVLTAAAVAPLDVDVAGETGDDDDCSGCWTADNDSSDGSDDDEAAEASLPQRSGCRLSLSAAELQPLLCDWNGLPSLDAAACCSRLSVFQQPRFDCLQPGQLPALLLPFAALRELEIVHQDLRQVDRLEALPQLQRSEAAQAGDAKERSSARQQGQRLTPPLCRLSLCCCSLRLSHARLCSLPVLSSLPSLRELWLDGNELQELDGRLLPEAILRLSIADNRIHALTELHTATPGLLTVEAAGNRLAAVPHCLCLLPELTALNLSRNLLCSLSAALPLRRCASLLHLKLSEAQRGPSPLSSLLHYSTFLLHHLPALRSLDGQRLDASQAQQADAVWGRRLLYYDVRRKDSRSAAQQCRSLCQQLTEQSRATLDEHRRQLWSSSAGLAVARCLCAAQPAACRAVDAAAALIRDCSRFLNACSLRLSRCQQRVSASLSHRQLQLERLLEAEMESGGNCSWDETEREMRDVQAALDASSQRPPSRLRLRRAIRLREQESRLRFDSRAAAAAASASLPSQAAAAASGACWWFLGADGHLEPDAVGLLLSSASSSSAPLSLWSAPSLALQSASCSASAPAVLLLCRAVLPDSLPLELSGSVEEMQRPAAAPVLRLLPDAAAAAAPAMPRQEEEKLQLSVEAATAAAFSSASRCPPLLRLLLPDPSWLRVQYYAAVDSGHSEAGLPTGLLSASARCLGLRESLLPLQPVLGSIGPQCRMRMEELGAALASVDALLQPLGLTRTAVEWQQRLSPCPALSCCGCGLLTAPLALFSSPLSSSLRLLSLSCNSLSCFLPPVPLPALRELDLSYNSMQAAAFTAATFTRLPELRRLHARHNALSLRDSETLLAALSPCRHLAELDLGLYEADGDEQDGETDSGTELEDGSRQEDAAPELRALVRCSAGYSRFCAAARRAFPCLRSLDCLPLPATADERSGADSPDSPLDACFEWRQRAQQSAVSASPAPRPPAILTAELLFQHSVVLVPVSGLPASAAGAGCRLQGGRLKASDVFRSECGSLWQQAVTELQLDGLSLRSLLSPACCLALPDFTRLTRLSLNGNRLSSLQLLTAAPLPALQGLSLDGNALQELDALPQLCPALTRLDASDNELRRLPALPPLLRSLSLERNRLISLMPPLCCPSLTELHARGNPLAESRSCQSLIACRQLSLLDLSDSPLHASAAHRLRAVHALPWLAVLDQSAVTAAEREAAARLLDGRLSEERLAAAVGHSLFAFVEHLELSRCSLRNCDALTAACLPHLRSLSLEDNLLTHTAHLRPLPSLRRLLLSRNRLTQLDTAAQARLWQRQYRRELGEAEGEEREDGAKQGDGEAGQRCHLSVCFPQLEALWLSCNCISSWSSLPLAGLQALRSLVLDGNQLDAMSEEDCALASCCPRLRLLVLAGNRLRRLEAAALLGCQQLEALQLEDNGLRCFPPLPDGRCLPALTQLCLAANPLSELSDIDGLRHSSLPALSSLTLSQTPLARRQPQLYRTRLLRHVLPSQLLWLDGGRVSDEERERAAQQQQSIADCQSAAAGIQYELSEA